MERTKQSEHIDYSRFETLVSIEPIYKGFRVLERDRVFPMDRETLIDLTDGVYTTLSSIFVKRSEN